jgi:uncharacterized transporter YbjL
VSIINWADIAWVPIGLLAGLAFVSSVIGNSLTKNAFVGAIITVIIFVAVFVFWDYYDHKLLPGVRFPTKY